jgi:nicotinamide-nucleotide amidase
MVEEVVLPWLRELAGDETVHVARTFQTFGLTESALDELVAGAVDPGEARLSFRASFPEISVRLVVRGRPGEAEARADALAARIRERIGPFVYGEGQTTMEEVVGRLLREQGLTVATAESCTAGLVTHRLTNVPGSSQYVLGGVVGYANSAKMALLGVRRETLVAHGAVSDETAGEMAAGARRAFGASLGLSTTGVAGPDGGTPEKPVGTVYLGLAWEGGSVTRRYQLWGTRDWVKLLASQIALDWLRRHALGIPVTESQLFRPKRS